MNYEDFHEFSLNKNITAFNDTTSNTKDLSSDSTIKQISQNENDSGTNLTLNSSETAIN